MRKLVVYDDYGPETYFECHVVEQHTGERFLVWDTIASYPPDFAEVYVHRRNKRIPRRIYDAACGTMSILYTLLGVRELRIEHI